MDESKQIILVSLEDLRCILYEMYDKIKKEESAKPLPEEKQLLSTDETLELLHVSRPTLWRWNKAKYLCPIKVGERNNFYKMEDIKRIQGERPN